MSKFASAGLIFVLFFGNFVSGQEKTLTVGVELFEPLVIKGEVGGYTGFDIDLFNAIAEKLGVKAKYEEVSFGDIFDLLEKGKVDVCLSGITINEDRESRIDFTHPYFNSGLGIMVRAGSAKNGNASFIHEMLQFRALRAFGKSIASPKFFEFLICLGVILVFLAHLIWIADQGSDKINDKYIPGIFESIYFCVVTASTVGYGDITVVKWTSRFFVIVLIITGVSFFCNLTALLSANYTVDKLQYEINGPGDLIGKAVATEPNTTSADYLSRLGAKIKFMSLEAAYKKLVGGEIDAVVFDIPALKFYMNGEGNGKVVLVGGLIEPQEYGFALPSGSKLREEINCALLHLKENGRYKEIYEKWFGKSEQ
jgi:polar amino acid transport system substrate-binding protein